MSPNDIKELADAIDKLNLSVSHINWVLGFIIFGIILLFILDRLYFFKKVKDIYEERLNSLKERCEAEKAQLKAKYESEKAKLIIEHSREQMKSFTPGAGLLQEIKYEEKQTPKGKTDGEIQFHRLVAAGMQYERVSRFDLAIECYEEALEKRPNDIGLHLQLGGIYGEKIGDKEGKEKAIEHCMRVLEIDKNNLSAKFNLAVYTNHLKGAEHSLPIYLEAGKLIRMQGFQNSELDGKWSLFIGHDYKFLERKPEAIDHYKKAIEILKKLADAGDISSQFWLRDAQNNLENLLKDIKN